MISFDRSRLVCGTVAGFRPSAVRSIYWYLPCLVATAEMSLRLQASFPSGRLQGNCGNIDAHVMH